MIYKVEHSLNICGEHSWEVHQYKTPLGKDTPINQARRSSFGLEVFVDSEAIGIKKGDNVILKVLNHAQRLMMKDFGSRLKLLWGNND
jgi:hypothetical protein